MARAAHKGTKGDAAAGSGGNEPVGTIPDASPGAGEAERRLDAAERALRRADRKTLRRAPAVYLNGESLDRGALCLTHHSLRFDGWQGSIVIPVHDIIDVRLGTSVLPRHAGVPLLGRLWPGKPRYAESLLLTVQGGSAASEPHVATVADLRDGIRWRDDILQCRDDYDAWARERSQRVAAVEAAERDLARERGAGGQAPQDGPSQDSR